jgi:hypothetical protein
MSDQLSQTPIVKATGDNALFIEACLRMLEVTVMTNEPFDPESDRAGKNWK